MTDPSILIADDDALILRFLVRGLQNLGPAVFPAATPAEALDIARAHNPCLAILDIDFKHDINGYELCRKIAEIPGCRPDVMFMSGIRTADADRLKAYESGAIAFHAKPFSPEWLRREVEFLLREPRPLLQLAGPDGGPCPSNRKVLVVEDSAENAKALCLHLEEQRFTPYWASKGAHAVAMARKVQPDAIVLDIGLPDMNGAEVYRLLRHHPMTRHVPVVAWTASTDPRLEVAFLKDEGADYVVKGVHDMASVPARIDRLLRKSAEASKPDGMLERGRIKVDTTQRKVWVGGLPIDGQLGPKRFDLLCMLLRDQGSVNREALRDAIWGEGEDLKMVDVTICRLRKDLGVKEGEIIISVPAGYQLVG
ncbi:MAG: response regulator [Elusimicrobiota bacterium]